MNILISGDFCPRKRIAAKIEQNTWQDIFADVKSIIQSADLSIVNFECPVVIGDGKPTIKRGPNLRCIPKAVQVIQEAGFDMVTLANNHILDYGDFGVNETIQTLDKYGIRHVGAGDSIEEAAQTQYYTKDNKTLAIINCCEHEFSIATDTSAGANPLNPMQQYYQIQEARKQADYVLVIVHGGHEHCQYPSPRMQETYRFFVDAGADAVVNHHQHCYSGCEVYQGKPIVYGLGNFCFDESSSALWTEGYMVAIHFEEKVTFTLHPYVQCADKPVVRRMNSTETKAFDNRIEELNRIIASSDLLQQAINSNYQKMSRSYLMPLTPYRTRIGRALASRQWIPMGISRGKVLTMINGIDCEAHRDRFLYALREFLQEY